MLALLSVSLVALRHRIKMQNNLKKQSLSSYSLDSIRRKRRFEGWLKLDLYEVVELRQRPSVAEMVRVFSKQILRSGGSDHPTDLAGFRPRGSDRCGKHDHPRPARVREDVTWLDVIASYLWMAAHHAVDFKCRQDFGEGHCLCSCASRLQLDTLTASAPSAS
jgi:hypothetical protein